MISTVVASIGGGAAVIEHFGLQHWVNTPIGLCAMGGLIFACGLPGWAIVRWVLNCIRPVAKVHSCDSPTAQLTA